MNESKAVDIGIPGYPGYLSCSRRPFSAANLFLMSGFKRFVP